MKVKLTQSALENIMKTLPEKEREQLESALKQSVSQGSIAVIKSWLEQWDDNPMEVLMATLISHFIHDGLKGISDHLVNEKGISGEQTCIIYMNVLKSIIEKLQNTITGACCAEHSTKH